MTAKDEQETTLTGIRSDGYALIYTSDTRHLHRLHKLAASEDFINVIAATDHDATFEVRAENFNPLMAIRKKRQRSEAQIAAAKANGERLAAARGDRS